MKVFDAFIAYQFIKILATPWEKSKAFEMGIVDENGKQLKKSGQLKTTEEKKSYTIFHRLIFNVKRLLEKLPFGKTKLASYATALALLKEQCEEYDMDYDMMEDAFVRWMEVDSWNRLDLKENAPTVNISGGAIAGAGVGHKGEPGVRSKKFAGHKMITVNGDTFTNLRQGKAKRKKWSRYINMESAEGRFIKNHFKRNPSEKLFMQWGDDGPIQEIIA